MLPKRVGDPSAIPTHSSRSLGSAYGAPLSGTALSTASHTADTRGTVRMRAAIPGTCSAPRAMNCAICRTAP